ncbi:hypothetical protein LMG26690_00236 [Achromobacter animicus]|uniref:HTH tetR-type domain-containing protein n=1 Tax=Achromobacter animicus TaxID=1389935 RepID=A0A6S6YZH1_9BURK|nr:TetR/AcrR family transcriptional regulator [Achromobacter animicus]CAB3654615.1 hypothetical protein LMG26690_00236 [Achromobacter animicus]
MTSLSAPSPRRRLSKDARQRQLIDVSWALIRDEGTDALTLGRLAEQAGVSKPVVYDHFGTRNGLLAALYQDFDQRQTAIIDDAIAASKPTLQDKADVIATRYVECVSAQGREIPGVLAALNGSPELAAVKTQYQHAFIRKCQDILAPFAGSPGVALASLWGMLGAADALSQAAVAGEITQQAARDELFRIIVNMVKHARPPDK